MVNMPYHLASYSYIDIYNYSLYSTTLKAFNWQNASILADFLCYMQYMKTFLLASFRLTHCEHMQIPFFYYIHPSIIIRQTSQIVFGCLRVNIPHEAYLTIRTVSPLVIQQWGGIFVALVGRNHQEVGGMRRLTGILLEECKEPTSDFERLLVYNCRYFSNTFYW